MLQNLDANSIRESERITLGSFSKVSRIKPKKRLPGFNVSNASTRREDDTTKNNLTCCSLPPGVVHQSSHSVCPWLRSQEPIWLSKINKQWKHPRVAQWLLTFLTYFVQTKVIFNSCECLISYRKYLSCICLPSLGFFHHVVWSPACLHPCTDFLRTYLIWNRAVFAAQKILSKQMPV